MDETAELASLLQDAIMQGVPEGTWFSGDAIDVADAMSKWIIHTHGGADLRAWLFTVKDQAAR